MILLRGIARVSDMVVVEVEQFVRQPVEREPSVGKLPASWSSTPLSAAARGRRQSPRL